MTRIIAIDWSGAKAGAAKKIWRADVVDGRLAYLRNGFTTTEVGAQLIDLACREPKLAVGLDFSFSIPAWFLTEHNITSGPMLWERVSDGLGEQWLGECNPPFWGRRGSRRPIDCDVFRRTERDVFNRTGFHPMSTFQIGGNGAPGTGSLRGMPVLYRLHEAGFAVWPFDPPLWPLVFEIYPRVFTGSVRKSNSAARVELTQERYPNLNSTHARAMCASDDAFDAAVSALELWRHRDEIARLPRIDDESTKIEGAIWYPGVC